MASGHSDYKHGTMEVAAQSGTFSGFMGGTKYGGALLALVVLLPTLIFAVGMPYLPALITTIIFGFVVGFGLKFKGGWYVGVILASILLTLFVGVGALFISMIA